MLLPILILTAGFVLLHFGGNLLVKGSSSLALRLGLTPLVIGLTVVAFGTSSPELAVSLQAAFRGAGDVAIGNVMGSNICNLGLILAIAALLRPMKVAAQVVRVDLPIMIGVSLLVPILLHNGLISRLEGALLFTGLVAYLALSLYLARRESAAVKQEFSEQVQVHKSLWLDLGLVVGGLAGLMIGGSLFVKGAVELARGLGISEAVIGLTVVAIGTSMPEMATSVVAALKGEGDIAIGNVVGSNIFNVLCILGTTAMIEPLRSTGITPVDLWVMVGMAAISWPLMHWSRRLGRLQGATLLVAYLCYVGYLLA